MWEVEKTGLNQEQVVTEWEKNKIKNVFKKLDTGTTIKFREEKSIN